MVQDGDTSIWLASLLIVSVYVILLRFIVFVWLL